MEAMFLPLRRYARFRGRARRREFWLFVLFVLVATIVLSILDTALGLGGSSFAGRRATGTTYFAGARTSGGLLTWLFTLAVLIPSLAVQVRRLHDTDRSGWWLLVPVACYVSGTVLLLGGLGAAAGAVSLAGSILIFAGFIGALVLLIFMCLEGTRGGNRFGADPKQQDIGDVFA